MVQFFPSDQAALFFTLAGILWILSEVVGSCILPSLRRKGARVETRDRGSGLLILLAMLLSLGIAFTCAFFGIALLPGWVSSLGSALMAAGIVVRQWSITILGSFFSPGLGIHRGQRVVTRGPYRWIRHPAYTGALMTISGVGLALQSWGAVLLILFIAGLAFGYRIRLEEQVLASELGEEYITYSAGTKRLIPYLL